MSLSHSHFRASQSTKSTRSVLSQRDENINYNQPISQSIYLSKSTSSIIKPRRSLGSKTSKSTKQQSKSMKARPGWQDPLLKDPSQYRLSEDQLIDRKLKRMSKRQLCEIAGIPIDLIDSPRAMNQTISQSINKPQHHYDEPELDYEQPEIENEFPWMNQQHRQSVTQSVNQFDQNQVDNQFVDPDDDEYHQPINPPNSRASSRPVSSHSIRFNQSIKPPNSQSSSRPLSANQSTNQSINQSVNQSDQSNGLETRMASLLARIATHLDASNARAEEAESRLVDCEARLIDQTDRLIDCERRMSAMENAFLVLTEENQSIKQELTGTINHLETQTINQSTELIKRISSIEEKAAARAAKKRQMLLAARSNQSINQSSNPSNSQSINQSTTPSSSQQSQSRSQRPSSAMSLLATPIQQTVNPSINQSTNQSVNQSHQQPMVHSRNRPSVPFVSSGLSTPQSTNQSTHHFNANDSLLDTPSSKIHPTGNQSINQSFLSPFTIPSLRDDDATPRSSLPSPYRPDTRQR